MGNGSAQFIILALMFAFFYFVIIRPQRRRLQAQQSLQRSLQLGDEIVTIGGFHGVIRRFDGDVITIELSPGAEARINRGAVARRVEPDLPEAIDEPDEDEIESIDEIEAVEADRADDGRDGRPER
ncbi:MAG TPA: preprotein translocase subunit YajC [Actinomycetes bacterium]|jgi:preprotein translocase subunit YajC|nr:preprotein translocase subunit YajC [Actinomycetes bacterium]